MSLSGVVILFIQKFYIVLFIFIPQLICIVITFYVKDVFMKTHCNSRPIFPLELMWRGCVVGAHRSATAIAYFSFYTLFRHNINE